MDYVKLPVERIIDETEKAFFVFACKGKHWIPKSQIRRDDEYAAGDMDVVMEVSRWIAEQRGLLCCPIPLS